MGLATADQAHHRPALTPQYPEWAPVSYDRNDVVIGDPSHNRNLVLHQRCYLRTLRIDLYLLFQPTALRRKGRIAKLLISRQDSAAHLPYGTIWRAIGHVEEAYETELEVLDAIERLKADVIRLATQASL